MLTAALCLWAVLLSGAWRLWLGGTPRDWPFKTGQTAFKYVVGLGLAGGMMWHLTQDWRLSLIAGIGYLAIWRAYGHGPMLQVPLGDNAKDLIKRLVDRLIPPPEDKDLEWNRAIGANLRWGLYGLVRYVIPCVALGGVLAIFGARWWPVAASSLGILAAYRITWARRLNLDYDLMRWVADISPTPDMRDSLQPYSFAHPFAGAALMIGLIASVM